MDPITEGVLSDAEITEHGKVAEAGEGLRGDLVKFMGLPDDETNKAMYDKLVEREGGLRGGYGKLLGKYKDIRTKVGTKPAGDNSGQIVFDPNKFREEAKAEAKATVLNELNENFLDEADYTDDFKKKIRDELARNPGKTAQSLLKNSDYLKFNLEKEIAAKKTAEAANNGTGEGRSGKEGKSSMPEKFSDPAYMATPEGQKAYDEWEKSK